MKVLILGKVGVTAFVLTINCQLDFRENQEITKMILKKISQTPNVGTPLYR
jgi:hypothetical protein